MKVCTGTKKTLPLPLLLKIDVSFLDGLVCEVAVAVAAAGKNTTYSTQLQTEYIFTGRISVFGCSDVKNVHGLLTRFEYYS